MAALATACPLLLRASDVLNVEHRKIAPQNAVAAQQLHIPVQPATSGLWVVGGGGPQRTLPPLGLNRMWRSEPCSTETSNPK
jgi:hypothetical protein